MIVIKLIIMIMIITTLIIIYIYCIYKTCVIAAIHLHFPMVPSRPPWPSTWPPVAAAEAAPDACRVQRRPERRWNMG
jgi:hypothetical protein